ncbi:hypothetical protein S1OALGB6SA_1784 [Olavius algarvensis spirochete endosymbiont]|uniref:CehA/McbA family metallohydrolase n=1 Tax=Olavius algarvensis spirochete endosymbiont TaxID=260710 RepID=UPI000F20C70C|nr:CehA/McbA family metallohydrolase [Olavius algarvensis spirochete endosymbiont]CAD7837374.1 MAG: hypothetical protein [Olavius algarvensis spirochete endosymbiont]VDB00696.1 hypothetical protein S1OALGB6SA_1784 [Olavius algarvensis spirochete endosymbiont]
METRILTDRQKVHTSYPDIAELNGTLFAVWQESDGLKESAKLYRIPDGRSPECVATLNNESNLAFTPRIECIGDSLLTVWSEKDGQEWTVYAQSFDGSVLGNKKTLDKAEGAFFPSILKGSTKQETWCFWTVLDNHRGSIRAMNLDGKTSGTIRMSTGISQAWRPEAVVGNDNAIWVVYDGENGGGYDIYLQRIVQNSDGKLEVSEPFIVSYSQYWATCPAIVPLNDSVLISWYESAPSNENLYCSAEVLHVGGSFVRRSAQKIDMTNNWYCWDELVRNEVSDSTYLLFSRGWKKTGVREYQNGAWSAEWLIPSDGDFAIRRVRATVHNGCLAVAWQRSEGNGQRHRWSDVGISIFSKLNELEPVEELDTGNAFVQAVPIVKQISRPDAEAKNRWDRTTLLSYDGLMPLWGDIHGQSAVSDGQGEVDEYFAYARDIARLDFTALTDHDCFPNIQSPSEFAYSCTVSNAFEEGGGISTILAYEWTSNEFEVNYGHKNVYFPGKSAALYRCTDLTAKDPPALFNSIRKDGAICVPHHPSAVWTLASAATDWKYHDDEVQRLVEICSRHAPFEEYGKSSEFTKNVKQKPGHSVVDALRKGFKLGSIGGSDSHQLEHGIEGGILAAYSKSRTRGDIFHALYNRIVYATTGARIYVQTELNGAPMGSVIPQTAGGSLVLDIRCLGTSIIRQIDIVTNVGIEHTYYVDSCIHESQYRLPEGNKINWCYIRVSQYDNHMAWTSPTWIE